MKTRWLILSALTLACLAPPAVSIGQDSKSQPADDILLDARPPDFNRAIYYRHKLEFSVDMGVLPFNIPFIFDPIIGDTWEQTPLHYTLVPVIASLRLHLGNIKGRSFLRGNTDATLSGSFTGIPRGPETHYGALMLGLRRNFVRPNWRLVPYFEGRVGTGFINAKGPKGVQNAQGEDFTFDLMFGLGLRYNFSPRTSISAGLGYMHISNLYLSEPKVTNYGINVLGPAIGVSWRIHSHKSELPSL